jgi:hypothetical protein
VIVVSGLPAVKKVNKKKEVQIKPETSSYAPF